MAKIQSNGYMKVAWVPIAGIANPQFPTASELNAGVDLTAAIAWEDYEVGASTSDDIEDRSIIDLGNSVSRGNANYAATLDFFRDMNNTASGNAYVTAFNTFKVPNTMGYIVTRVVEKLATEVWAAGDTVNVFKFIATLGRDITSGETSTKFQVNFLPQGVLYPNTMVATASAVLGLPTTDTLVVGERLVLTPTLDGKSIRSRATYTTSDATKATVSNHGVVTAVATGSATITATYGASPTPDTTAVTIS